MAAGVHIQEPVLDTLRREDENEMDQAINITLSKILVEGNIGDSHTPIEQAINITLSKILVEGNIGDSHTPIEPPDTLETDFEVKDSVKGKEGSASTIRGEKFLISPSAAEAHFEENNLSPDACQVTENAEKMATVHATDALHLGEAKLDAEESNGLEKGLVSALEVPATSEVGHDESIPVYEAGLSENKEDSESTIPEKEVAYTKSLKVNPEDAKTCVTVNDTETTSSVEEKSMTSSSQDIPGEKKEHHTNKETPENISTIVPNEETEQNLSIELVDSQMKTDKNLEKEDEQPESTLIPEGKIKNEESTQNELFETRNETEKVIQKSEEINENDVESSPVAASEAEDIEASTSDHDTKASALENKIPTENTQEIEVDKSGCKPEKETPQEQVITETTREASHDETTPVDKAKTEDKESNKSDFIETKEDTESTILVEEPILEKHLESLNGIHDDIKACDLVQETEAKSSIKEKLPTATPQEIWGEQLEQTSFDTKEETPEDISTNLSNEETEQNSIVEVPFVTEALTTDNKTEGKIKDEDQREKDLLENNNDTESELLKQEVTEKPVESLQLANVAEATQASTLDHDTKLRALENQILTENSQEIVADETESKPCDVVDAKKETLDVQDVSTIESNDDSEENLVIEEDEREKPLSREESTRDAGGHESTYTHEVKNEGEDLRRAELLENPNFAESLSLIEDNTIPKLVESPQVDAEDIKTHVLDQDAETTGLISASEGNSNDGESAVKYEVKTEDDDQKEDQLFDNEKNPESNVLLEAAQIETPIESLQETLPSTVPQGFLDDKTEDKTVDAIQKDKEILDNISTIVPNEETEQNLSVELDHSHMKTDENSEKEDEKPESALIPEGKIKNEESMQNELFETENETETVIQKSKEVIEKGVESSPVAASEAGVIETSTSDHHTETSALENKIATENPQEIEVDKLECKPEKETPKEQVSTSASMTSEDASLTKHEAHLEKESEKPCFKDASTKDASHDETTPVDKAMKEDDEPSKSELFENKEDTESTILVEEPILENHLESLNAIFDDIKACDLVEDTETKSSIKEKLQTATPQEIWGDKIDQASFDTKEETPKDISTNVSNEETKQNSIVEVPFVTEALTTDNELAITRGKIKDEDQRGKDLLENNNDTESELLKHEVIEKPVESLQLANEAEDTKVSTSDHDTTISVLENQILTENPQEIVADETESKPCDVVDTKKETLDGQDVSTIESNDDNEENLVIEGDERKKPLLREESTRDAIGDESIYTHEDKNEGEDQRRAELFDNENSAESLSLIEDNTIPKLVESPQVDAGDIKTHVLDQDAETTSLISASEGKSNNGESLVKYEVKTEDDDQKEDQLCDNEKNPKSNVLLEAAQLETPIASLQETLLITVPQGFLDDETEEKTVDAIHTDKENQDVQNVTKTVSNEKIEEDSLIQMDGSPIHHGESLEKEHKRPSLIESIDHDSLLQVDGSQIQCKEYSEEKSEITSIIETSTKNINDDNPVNVHEDSSEHEDLRKGEFGDTEIISREEEAQVETPANSSNIAAEDIIASDLCRETETTCSQEDRTLNEEETVCERIEVETLDTSDTKTQTSEAQDVSTIVPSDDSGENSATEENDLQMKNEENFGKETEKPAVTETSTTYASDDDSANKCEDKVEGEERTGAELFEDKKDMESKLSKEKEIMVRLVESPQVDNEDIKTYVSDEGAETTGMAEASEGNANNHESAVKNEVKTEDNDKKEDELSDNEKNTESGELLEAAQTEKSIESLQETLPSTVPRGFLDDNNEEKTGDALQKDEDVQNVSTTVPNEKIEEKSLIQMDGSQIQHEEYLEKEHEIPSVIEALTKHANYDDLIAHEDNIEHEDPRKVEPESEKYTEITWKEDDAQIETHIKSLQVVAEDIIASDSYQGKETTDSQEEQILNENEIVHEETLVERLDAVDTKKETPKAPDVSTFVLNDDNEENLVIGEDDSEMKIEDNLGKESENPSSIEASLMDTSSDESTKKFEDKIEGKEHTRAEDTECTLSKEAETATKLLESPQVDAEDIKTHVSDQGKETIYLVEVFEEVAHDSQPEVKCMIKTEVRHQKEDELCDDEKIPDGTVHLEVAEMEKPFESLKEALPTSVPRGFLDEKTEEKIIDATENDEETLEIQNVTTIVSNENIEHDSLLQVDGSQMQCRECSEEESERTPIIEASTKNINDDDSINVHEDSTEHEDQRKDELVEIKEDTKITSQKEEAQVETVVKSLKIAAEDFIESDSCQETETMSSQEERILNEEEIVCEQIEVERLDTADTKTETPEAHDVSTIVPNDDIEANSATGENDSQMKNKENLGKESGKPSIIGAWTIDASSDESTNKCEDKIEGEEQTGAEMFVDKKDMESTLLKEEEIMVKLVESPHVDTENIKTYVSDKGAETTGVVEAFEGNADDDKSAIKYEVKTEDNDQKDNEKNPESGVLLEAAQIEKPVESLQETLTSTVPREFLDNKTEEKTMDAIKKDEEILDIQSVAKTVSYEKIKDNPVIQADSSQIQHEEYLEKEIEIPSVIEASTKHADEDELISVNEDNIEHKDLRKVELLEINRDTEINLQKKEAQMETSVKSLQVAAEDIIASDSYHGTETTSQEEQFLNENEIIHEQTEVERLDTADSDKDIPEAQNFAIMLSSENIKENSRIPEDGSEQKREELLEKESKAPPSSETSTMEVNDEVPEVIHQDKIEDEKVDKFDCDKHEEITLLNKAPAEKLHESSKEDLEDIKDIVSGANTIERSLIEVQSPNENQREIVGDYVDENIVDKDPELKEIEDEHLDKDAMFKNEKYTEIGFIKEEESLKKLEEPEKKDLKEIKAFVSYEGTETTSSIEERDLTDISQESVGGLSEDKILDKAQEIPDFTIVSGEHAEKKSSIQPDGSQMKHEKLSEKECEMLSTPETSFLYSSNDEPMTVDVENIEKEHLNNVDKFEDDKHAKIAIINDQAPVEEPQESSSTQKLLTKFVSDENGEDISLMLVDESQIKHEELLEKESEASPLSETSLRNSNFNESTILHQDKIQDELLNRVDKFESEKHAEISLIKEEAPLEKLNESPLRKDLEEIKAFDLSEDTETSSTGERNLTAIPQENDFSTVDASQIKHEELLERESKTPPLPLLHSSDGKSAIVDMGKIEDEVLEKADKFEGIESGEAALLNEEARAEKLTESSKDLEGIKESIKCDGTEITHSTEEQNLTTISQEIIDDQQEEKVLNVTGETSDFTTIIPHNNNTERNLLVEVHASQMKHEEHLEEEREMPSLLMLNTSTEEPTIFQENKIMEHAGIILSHEEALENSSKEENENIKASVLCEDSETSSIEQESMKANSHEIVGDQEKEKIIDMAQNAPDLTTITSDENSEENSLIQLHGSQIKHEEPQERENETPSMSMLDTTIEESTILQGRITDYQDPRKVDEFEREKDTEATLLKDPTPAEKVTESVKDDLEDTKVFLSCEDKEITSSIEEHIQKDNQQEIVVDQTTKNILDSATEAQDFKQTVSHENGGENLLIQVDESEVKHEIVSNVLDTAPKDQDLKPAISHENAEENSLIQVDEIQMKHDELEKESETPSLLIVDTSNKESKTVYQDITEDANPKKIHDFECEKHEEITSTEEKTQVTKVNESSKQDLEDVKALVLGEDSETTSFEEKQSLKENPREILSDQQEEKILDIAHEAQNFIKVVSNENVEKDSVIQEDESPMVHEKISEKEGATPSLSAALNATSEDSTVIHENKIENEDTREVDISECEKHVDGKILDAAREASESKIIVLDEKTEEKSSNQVNKSQTKHEELLEKESKTLCLSKTSLLNTSNEDSTTINDNKIEDEEPERVDELECEKHTEFPLTKEEEPEKILNNHLKEDIEEIKEFVSCLDTETTSSTEDLSLQINPQEVMGDHMEENIIDTTPGPQNFTTLVSDEITKENLSLKDDESQIKHEELLENESEKPSLWILKTSNEESSFICHSKTENEDVKRHEKVEQLNDFPEEGPEIIEVPVPSENLETPSPVEERSLTENPQVNLTKDEILDVVPEALESKTIVSDKNIEENSFILEDGSQMKHEEHSEKESEKPFVSENSIPNTRNEEPTLFLDDKIEEEDQAKGNKSECEKHAEITEVSVEKPNSSNLENIEGFVSCEDIEPTNSTEEQSLTVNPIENVEGQEVEKVLDKALEAQDFTPVVPDDNNDDNPSIQLDGSQMKHEEPLEKESDSLKTSLLNTNNEETETIHKDLIEDEALENVDEFESKKCSEINKLKEEAQVEESTVYKDIKAYVLYQDTEASALQEKIIAANPQDILGNQSEDNVIDTADSKEKITEQYYLVSNENVVKDSLIQIDESETKHEENLEKEPYLEKTSTVESNNESTTSHEGMIEKESGKIIQSALLDEGSPVYKSVESLQVVSEDIKASVSSQKMGTKSLNLNSDPQEIAGEQKDDKINKAGTREINLEALNLTTLDSNENKILDSITPHDGLEIEDEEISMLAENKESIIVHEDTIEGEDLKKVDTFEGEQQTEDTLLKEEAHKDESMDSLHVASEPIKASVSCQDRDPTSSLEEQILTTTPKIVVDQVGEKLTDTAKTWEETPEVSSSVLAFQEDEANRIGVDDINSVMIKDEETVNISNAAENDEICSSDKVQAKEEEMEIISKTKIDEEADKDNTWSKLTDDETNKTSIEEKEIDFSSHDKDTSEITRHDGAKDITKGNENSTSKNEFLEDGYSNGSTESTTSIVNEDAEKIDKDIKAETVIAETGAASSALPITGVQCGPGETESEDSTEKETETSLAPEGRECQGQHTKIHESPCPPLSHVKDSEWEMAQERGRDNLQSGDDTNDNKKELDEGSAAISNYGNFLEANSNENMETEVTAGEKEASEIQQDPVSEFVVQEIQEQPGKTVEAVPEEKGIKSEQGEIKFDDSGDLKINSSTMVTDKVAPSDTLCSFTSDAGQRAVDQETQIVVQEKQKPGKGEAIEAVPEEKGINTGEDEIKEHNFNVLKENSRTVALDKVTPVNILQDSTTDAALRATDEETPEQYGLDQASLKDIEGGPASTTDKLTVLRADQIDNANFDSSLGSNKIPVLQHEDSSESSQTEGEKQKTSEPEKGEKRENEETAKLMEMSESTEMDKSSLSRLLQEPMKEVLKVVDEPTTKEEELLVEKSAEVEHVEAKTDKEKVNEKQSGENQISELSSDAPVMVGAADKDVKVAHKKSHSILSGVGSKVKHSISKVKKAITGKSSHPKSASPKYSDRI